MYALRLAVNILLLVGEDDPVETSDPDDDVDSGVLGLPGAPLGRFLFLLTSLSDEDDDDIDVSAYGSRVFRFFFFSRPRTSFFLPSVRVEVVGDAFCFLGDLCARVGTFSTLDFDFGRAPFLALDV